MTRKAISWAIGVLSRLADTPPQPTGPRNRRRERITKAEADALLRDIANLCRYHGLSLTHEDHYGGFTVSPFSLDHEEWLLDGRINEEYR